MPLYQVQDPDRPMHVHAPSWEQALAAWREVIVEENGEPEDGEEITPFGIRYICEESEFVEAMPEDLSEKEDFHE